MNVKKYLKKQAEQDEQEILDADDNEFLDNMKAKIKAKSKHSIKNRNFAKLKIGLPVAAGIAVAATAITCIAVYYPFNSGRVEYFEADIADTAATLEDLNRDVKEFDIRIDPSVYTYDIKKKYDRVSGDVLFYTTVIDNRDLFLHMEIIAVCNPNYHYKDFSLSDGAVRAALERYTVDYLPSTTIDPEFGFEEYSTKAKIQKGKEFVYVTQYSELLFEAEDSFFEVLQEIVK